MSRPTRLPTGQPVPSPCETCEICHSAACNCSNPGQALLAVVTAITDVMLVYLDRDFNFVWVNQAYADTCQVAAVEMVGQNHFALYPNVENEAIFRRVRDTGVAVFHKDKPFEFPDQPERGVTYWDWSLSADKTADGRVVGLVFSLRDTTAHVRARQAEDEHAHRYRQLFENIDEGFALHETIADDSGAPADYRILEANPAFERLTGLARTQLIGQCMRDVLPGIDAHWADNYAHVARTGQSLTFESYSQPLDRWYRVHVYQPAPRQLAAIFSDITQRKAMEARLIRARKEAERQTRAKSAFLATMSHEIRTPLHIITGLAHLLRKQLGERTQRERIEQICLNTEHLLGLINDILDLSKIESDRLTLAPRDFRLGGVLDRVLRMFETPARDKGLTPALDAAPALHALGLHGDPLRLAQVLINLCSNAVKFTERGSVRLAVALLADDGDRVGLRFVVEDTGIGIAAADRARIFEPFVQADCSTTRAYHGTGLGLAISQRLVAMMGGTLSLDSRIGEGSRLSFNISLPRAAAAAVDAAEAAELAVTNGDADFSGRQVLLAEDHPLSQEILGEMLAEIGCDIEVAGDGAEALACATRRHYDLILMDMQMPRMDGLAATRAIRALPGHAETPIVALTANAFAEDRHRCLAAGMNGHLGKPVTPEALAQCLGRWLPTVAPPAAPAGTLDLASHPLGCALLAIPGLSIPAAMCRSPDDLDNYLGLLERYVRTHGGDMQRLRRHLHDGARDAAHGIAHDLKGISGLIGIRRVAELADELARGIRPARAGTGAASHPDRAEVNAIDAIDVIADLCERELTDFATAVARLARTTAAPAAAQPTLSRG